ncbi:GNAT family N-acetyltransferase [Niveispirillum lacus]|uniref:GNAT family N-acetyltransferase n=1 Tax=Niveispirillum lacus TaxID=1981099 RepID=A0A255Z1F6_9PROT|nr:GNAT family N-acetyltransferase [Niveispirillum lacus]OYQ35249.1 GNAT family N-acetyltransferase [Niveispirillum lacus]
MANEPVLRLATPADRPALERLVERSVRDLSRDHYSTDQIDASLKAIFGIDGTLIADGTYFTVLVGECYAACGGWSRRRTLFGGDQAAGRSAELLNPVTDAAKIRAFFVDPAFARRGLASRMMRAAEQAALSEGFKSLELMATLPGVSLYLALGFIATGTHTEHLPDGHVIPFVPMRKSIG